MTDQHLTETQLARIRDGATLVATAAYERWECPECGDDSEGDAYLASPKHRYCGNCAGDCGRDVSIRRLGPGETPPFDPGTPIHPSLPGLTWGKSWAVRLSDLTTDIALQLGFDGGLKPSEVYDEWFWLTEVKRPCM